MTGPLQVVLVTGAPGVGKTSACRMLLQRYRVPSAVVECDPMVDPWESSEQLYELMAEEFSVRVEVYRRHGTRVIIACGIFLVDRALPHLAARLDVPGIETVTYGLRARPEVLAERIRADSLNATFLEARLDERHLDHEVARIPGVREIDTSDLDQTEVADRLTAAEAGRLAPGWMLDPVHPSGG